MKITGGDRLDVAPFQKVTRHRLSRGVAIK